MSPPDLAVNLHGAGPQSIEDLAATGAHRLLTHRHPHYPDIAGPDWCEEMHEVERWTRLLILEGIPADPTALGLARPEQSPAIPHAVIVHPGAKAPARRWPVSRFGAVARALPSPDTPSASPDPPQNGTAASLWPDPPASAATACWQAIAILAGSILAGWPPWSRMPAWSSAGTPGSLTLRARTPLRPWSCSVPRPLPVGAPGRGSLNCDVARSHR